MRVIALVLLLSGCAEAQEVVEDARLAVHDTGVALERLRAQVVTLCDVEDPPEACPELVRDFNALQAAYTRVNEYMP